MTDSLISICIPVYNGEKYLEDCLKSVAAQTYKNIEILLVDDCSSDESANIAKRFAKIDARIRYFRNERNIGLVDNWKKCIEYAQGEWVKLFFQDDLMLPDCVEKMFNACLTNKVQFALCARSFIIEESASPRLKSFFENEAYRLENTFRTPGILNQEEILKIAEKRLCSNFLGEPIVTFFKKILIQEIGNFKLGLPQLVDYEFLLRVTLNIPTYFIPDKLVSFRVHGGAESDKHHDNNEKQLRNELIEPIVLFHEYLFDKRLEKIRSRLGFFELFSSAVSTYRKKALFYQRVMIKENLRPLYIHFRYLFFIVFVAEITLLFKRIRLKYFA